MTETKTEILGPEDAQEKLIRIFDNLPTRDKAAEIINPGRQITDPLTAVSRTETTAATINRDMITELKSLLFNSQITEAAKSEIIESFEACLLFGRDQEEILEIIRIIGVAGSQISKEGIFSANKEGLMQIERGIYQDLQLTYSDVKKDAQNASDPLDIEMYKQDINNLVVRINRLSIEFKNKYSEPIQPIIH